MQSPLFLYRIELSDTVVDGVIPLADHEIASRLSYFLWNTMPDDELLDVADAGMLHTPDQVLAQAERMVDDPRAADMSVRFHDQLLRVGDFETIAPSPTFYPDAPANLSALAIEEQERFVRDVVYGEGGGLADLLTSSETFVNGPLAQVYGIEGIEGDEFVHVELDPNHRRGVFTHVGFLAANATSVDPDPIHRGVFMATNISCLHIAAPPDGVPPLPAIEPGQTNRERVAAHTSAPQCASCHGGLINPYGFTFEHYDAMGGWRDTDNDQTVDASANVAVGGQAVPVDNAVELMDVLATDESVHRCYVKHWLEYAAGRQEAPEDEPTIARLGLASLDDGQSMQELLIALTTSRVFLTRAPEELQ